jgi:phosphate transport system permease protein
MINSLQKTKLIDQFLKTLLFVLVVLTLAITLGVIFVLFKESSLFFSQVPLWDFLTGTRWAPLLEPKSFGVLPLVVGTFIIVIGSILLALPAGLIIATYLSEFSTDRTRNIVKPVLEILAGIPTIVYGFFALTFITPVLKKIFPEIQIFNALSGAIVVGIMILPMVASLCDDGFRAVPKTLREGAYGLGAKSFEVILMVVIPASSSRIAAAVILAVSRAIGETMAVTLAAGATPNMTINPLESIQTMTAYIVQVSLGDTPAGGIEYQTCYAVGLLLFVMTFFMNVLGNLVMSRPKLEGM